MVVALNFTVLPSFVLNCTFVGTFVVFFAVKVTVFLGTFLGALLVAFFVGFFAMRNDSSLIELW